MSETQVACQACQTKFPVAPPKKESSAILNDDEFSTYVANHPRVPCPGCGLLHTVILTGLTTQWGIVVAKNQAPPQDEGRRIEIVSGGAGGAIPWRKS